MTRAQVAVFFAATFLTVNAFSAEDDRPLSLADLAPYRAAIEGKTDPKARPVAVSFRELWTRPDAYRGRPVVVEARVVRRFRQAAFGTFPPLEEAWAAAPSGDLFCLVFPASDTKREPISTTVRFTGVFLRRVRYPAGDVSRLAPLIVGARPPVAVKGPGSTSSDALGAHAPWLDWTVGVSMAAVVAMVLAWQHARRPIGRSPDRSIAAPEFTPSPKPAQAELSDIDADRFGGVA